MCSNLEVSKMIPGVSVLVLSFRNGDKFRTAHAVIFDTTQGRNGDTVTLAIKDGEKVKKVTFKGVLNTAPRTLTDRSQVKSIHFPCPAHKPTKDNKPIDLETSWFEGFLMVKDRELASLIARKAASQ